MPQVTIRNVKEDWIEEVKKIALEKNMSMNSVFLEMIDVAVGSSSKSGETNGMEKFSGDSADLIGDEFDQAVDIFSKIDKELWK